MRHDPLLDTRRWRLTSTTASGRTLRMRNLNSSQAKIWTLALRTLGHKPIQVRPEIDQPIPDALLTPNRQPEAVNAN